MSTLLEDEKPREPHQRLGRQSSKNQRDLKERLHSSLKFLPHRTDRVISLFKRPPCSNEPVCG
jgi:hypothetical protein